MEINMPDICISEIKEVLNIVEKLTEDSFEQFKFLFNYRKDQLGRISNTFEHDSLHDKIIQIKDAFFKKFPKKGNWEDITKLNKLHIQAMITCINLFGFYSKTTYKESYENLFNHLTSLEVHKNKEYATNNRYSNFFNSAQLVDMTAEQVLAGFALKHVIWVKDFIDNVNSGEHNFTQEQLLEKFGDILLYLILQNGLLFNRIKYNLSKQI